MAVVGDEGVEGGGVAVTVAVPEVDRFEAVYFGQFARALDAEPAFDVLQAAGQADAAGGGAGGEVGVVGVEGESCLMCLCRKIQPISLLICLK